jgi:hypothetical protein
VTQNTLEHSRQYLGCTWNPPLREYHDHMPQWVNGHIELLSSGPTRGQNRENGSAWASSTQPQPSNHTQLEAAEGTPQEHAAGTE